MFRYLGLTWNVLDLHAGATARFIAQRLIASSNEWRSSVELPGLAVFHTDARPSSSLIYPLARDAGVVVGKLFKKSTIVGVPRDEVSLGAAETDEIQADGGRHLTRAYWGRYVAFLRDGVSRTSWVLRDPTGALPCYTTVFQGVRIYFSYTEDCLALRLMQFSHNWRYITAYTCYPRIVQARDTALEGVSEIQPGECLKISADGAAERTWYWNPVNIIREGRIDDIREAIRRVRDTTQQCVAHWASCYPRVLHLLSGGLDSSIVFKCLLKVLEPSQIVGMTYFNSLSLAADERRYARMITDGSGTKLVEWEERVWEDGLDAILGIPRSATPWMMQYYSTHSRSEAQVAKEHGVSAIFYGVGGDQLFFRGPLNLIAADYMYDNGFGRDLPGLIVEIARAERVSVWTVLRDAMRKGWLRQKWDPLAVVREVKMQSVRTEVLEATKSDSYLRHPWLEDTAGVPWCKCEHARSVAVSHDFYDPMAASDSPERVRPLVSQPLIELCLQIPTYILAQGAYDRVVERRAFKHELPHDIVWRRSKGIFDAYYQHLLRTNARFLRELLLDGQLVKEGILDRQKLEDALSGKRTSMTRVVAEIVVFHAGTEAWLQSWRRIPQRVAA